MAISHNKSMGKYKRLDLEEITVGRNLKIGETARIKDHSWFDMLNIDWRTGYAVDELGKLVPKLIQISLGAPVLICGEEYGSGSFNVGDECVRLRHRHYLCEILSGINEYRVAEYWIPARYID